MSTTTDGHIVILGVAKGTGTDLPVAIVVFSVLLWLGLVIARRVAGRDSYPSLYKIMVWSVVLHLVCASLEIFVVHHFYGGVADFNKYDTQGRILADNWRNGHFTVAGAFLGHFINDGAVGVYGGIIMTLVGPNQLAAFFVAAWVAFVGTVFFYKAFSVTFPGVDRRFYAWLIFLFPSILFWTADVGKESAMMFALGLTAYGMALVLTGFRRGYLYTLLGGTIGLVVRPNETVLLVLGFAVAMVVRALAGGQLRRPRGALSTIGAVVFVVAGILVTGYATIHLFHGGLKNGVSGTLSGLSKGNVGTGAGFGSSGVPYSPNPLLYPRDVYEVLLDPFWFNAGSTTQIVASLENTLIFAVFVYSLSRLRYLFRVCVQRPYILMALIYTLVFFYSFAALGNLGLIERERSLVLPLLFAVLAIPVARPRERPYPWQKRRAKHKKSRLGPSPDERVPTEPVTHTMATVQWDSQFSDGARADWSSTGWGAEI